MKKLGISLLVLALVLSFVSANAATFGVRSNLTGTIATFGSAANANTAVVVGLDKIDLLVAYGTSTTGASGANTSTALGLGAIYWFANKGEVKVGVGINYNSTNTGASGANSTSALQLAIDGQAEIAKGLALGVQLPVYQTYTTGASGAPTNSNMLVNGANVYAQVTLF